MAYDATVSICRVENGFQISYRDPEIVKKNASAKGPYHDPERTFVFPEKKPAMEFLTKVLDNMSAADTYETEFTKALAKETAT